MAYRPVPQCWCGRPRAEKFDIVRYYIRLLLSYILYKHTLIQFIDELTCQMNDIF